MDLQIIQQAVKQISDEKGLSEELIMEAINSALAAAYRKDFGHKNQNIVLEFDLKSGKMKVFDNKIVVDFDKKIIAEIDENGRDKKYVKELEEGQDEEAAIKFNPKTEILLEDAKKIKKTIKVGAELSQQLEVPSDFGRMAAQTAKQVIIQKIREAEREAVYNDFKKKEGELIIGVIQRKFQGGVLVDMGKVTALMPYEEQIMIERYNPGDRMKFYIVSVEMSLKGPEIIVSRSNAQLLAKLFATEIPEINSEAIEIMAIAREAGARSKVAVKSNQENIDPIGSCVGQRGARIQTIINELGGEKIDIIQWDENIDKFISNALSPAKIASLDFDEKEKTAAVTVNEDQLSLAIGKEGQNVRLAAKLTGWKINILKETPEGKTEEIAVAGDKKDNDNDEDKEEKKTVVKKKESKKKTGKGKSKKKEDKAVAKKSTAKDKVKKKTTKSKETSKEDTKKKTSKTKAKK